MIVYVKLSRKNIHKTQKELAEYLGISECAYQNYEMGTHESSLEVLSELADYFNVSTDYLLGCFDDAERH